MVVLPYRVLHTLVNVATLDAMEQCLCNKILSRFKWFYLNMDGAVTITKWKVCLSVGIIYSRLAFSFHNGFRAFKFSDIDKK